MLRDLGFQEDKLVFIIYLNSIFLLNIVCSNPSRRIPFAICESNKFWV